MVNPQQLRLRARATQALRAWLQEEGFLEVHPPLVVPSPALEETLEAIAVASPPGAFLHTSPEFALKRALASGLHRIYSIVPCFRGEELGVHHRQEFTMLELYFTNGNYRDLLPVVEGLVAAAAAAIGVPTPTFTTTTVAALFHDQIPDDDDTFFRAWVEEIDPQLTAPTFVLDYPARHAALAEVRGGVAERMEVYLGGLELGNGFSELRDATELRARFEASARARAAAGRAPHPVDEAFLAATARLPRAAGIAIGLDRLVMALTGAHDIGDVQLGAIFPPAR